MKPSSCILLLIILVFFQQCKADSHYSKNLAVIRSNYSTPPPGWPWRGITIVSHKGREKVTEAAIEKLAEMGVNLIRLRLSVRKFAKKKNIPVEESTKNTFAWAQKIITWSNKNKIYVLISITDFPYDPKIKYNHSSFALNLSC